MTLMLSPALEDLLRCYAAGHGVDVESVVGEALRRFLCEVEAGRSRAGMDRYPLRGSVVRFDNPLDPVVA